MVPPPVSALPLPPSHSLPTPPVSAAVSLPPPSPSPQAQGPLPPVPVQVVKKTEQKGGGSTKPNLESKAVDGTKSRSDDKGKIVLNIAKKNLDEKKAAKIMPKVEVGTTTQSFGVMDTLSILKAARALHEKNIPTELLDTVVLTELETGQLLPLYNETSAPKEKKSIYESVLKALKSLHANKAATT